MTHFAIQFLQYATYIFHIFFPLYEGESALKILPIAIIFRIFIISGKGVQKYIDFRVELWSRKLSMPY